MSPRREPASSILALCSWPCSECRNDWRKLAAKDVYHRKEIAMTERSTEEVKSCCVTAYESDVAAMLLGESYHPGGLDLTLQLAKDAGVTAGTKVIDIASGTGASAFLLARELSARGHGIDLGAQNVEKATAKAAEQGLEEMVRFSVGDAEKIRFADESTDVVFCECAFSTFTSKEQAASEMFRICKPGGVVAFSDVVLEGTNVGEELLSLAGWIACIADAKPVETYVDYLEKAGFALQETQRHDDAIVKMVDLIEARIQAFSMIKQLPDSFDKKQAETLLEQARQAIKDDVLGYVTIIAGK